MKVKGSLAEAALLVQLGQPRTATTLQFQTLCAIQLLLHAYDASENRVHCTFVDPPWRLRLHEERCRSFNDGGRCWEVAKVHTQSSASASAKRVPPLRNATYRVAMFATAEGGSSEAEQQSARRSVASALNVDSIEYVATTGRVAALGHHLVIDYATLFSLNRTATEWLLE